MEQAPDRVAIGFGLAQPRRGLAVVSVLAAMSLAVLDAGMANVALPTMARELNAAPAHAVLVITAYQTALVMALLPCAALGERFGNRRMFQGGVALFVAASVLCALSPTLLWLVCARFLQGLGGAAVMALGVALLRFTVAPDRLGAAIGWNALAVALSSAAAPTLGALIIANGDWTWLFLANLPIGGLALLAALALPSIPGQGARLDLVSMALNGGVFALLVIGAEVLPSSLALGASLLAGAVFVVAGRVRRERPKAAPLVPLDLLRSRSFRLSVVASVCCFTATAAAFVALPFYLQHGLKLSAVAVGLYMSPWALSVAATVTMAGRLSDRVSTATLCAIGGGVLAIGLSAIALWPASGDPLLIVFFAAVCGVGFGLFQVPNNRNMFLAAPPERAGAAGGMQGTARLTGQTAGAVLMTLLFSIASVTSAPRIGIAIGAGLAVAAGLVSILRRPRRGEAADAQP
jgi:DHA2 family multidrug resistance protein-like MFS transporter